MKKLLIPLAALAVLLVVSVTTADVSGLEWMAIEHAVEKAPNANKKIVLDIYTDWCGWCKKMDKSTYANENVQKYLNEKFLVSKMNPEKEGKLTYNGEEYSYREFAQALQVRGYPATAFLNEKNEVLTVLPGYLGPDDFMNVLKYFGEDIYLDTKWEDYKASAKN